MSERVRQSLWQDGMKVAEVEGDAKSVACEIAHYALVYGQDGPVEIKERRGGKWQRVEGA